MMMDKEEEFIEKYCEWCENEECGYENDFPKLDDCMAEHKGEKEEYCISGFYSIVIEAESEEEAIKEAMTMQLNQMDVADVDFVNDMDYRQ